MYEIMPELAAKKYLSRDDLHRTSLTGKRLLLPEVRLLGEHALFWNQDVAAVSAPKAWYMKSSAFAGCKTLTCAELPQVERAEDRAFEDCELLREIRLPCARSIGDHAFRRCSSLETVELPGVQLMGDDLFEGCYSLKTLSLPGLEQLGIALRKCPALKSVEFRSLRRIKPDAFSQCYDLEELVLHMPYVCQLDQEGFTEAGRITEGRGLIYVPAVLAAYYQGAPGWCRYAAQIRPIPADRQAPEAPPPFELLSKDIPEEPVPPCPLQIPAGFEQAPVLKRNDLKKPLPSPGLLLPNATMLAERALSDTDLTAFSGPSVRIVNARAFSNCGDLLHVRLPRAERLGSYAFEDCIQLRWLSLPQVRTIEDRAFDGCNSLRYLSLPAVERLGSYVFNECYSLKRLVLPSAGLLENALRGLEALEALELHSVKALTGNELHDCFFLRELILKMPYVCPLERGAFSGVNGITLGRAKILVPWQLLPDYRTAPGWRTYEAQIEAIPDENG
ncbi:MAG: leucine-rich repeat domain-containing protein [Oscillospiraceae bacterium]|nr:leucine-rich repeat domain-containing protein [Oscillospiraceae bacterium]